MVKSLAEINLLKCASKALVEVAPVVAEAEISPVIYKRGSRPTGTGTVQFRRGLRFSVTYATLCITLVVITISRVS